MPPSWVDHLEAIGRDLVAGATQVLYPKICRICRHALPERLSHFCATCRTALTMDDRPTCPRCASAIGPFALVEGGCSRCRDETFAFAGVIRLGPYEGLFRDVVLRSKHQPDESFADLVGELWASQMADRLGQFGASVVIPVPLHWRRHWLRGFNHAAALARPLGARLGLPCRPGWLKRIRATPPQPQQTPSGRRDNVRNAFRASRFANLKGLIVLLVDDVLTTGSTAHEASRALRRAGAAQVFVAVLAHG